MSYLVIDFGTSSCRASIVSREGIILSSSRESVKINVHSLHAEIETDYVWSIVERVIGKEIKKYPNEKFDAIGVSALLGYVFLDKNNEPVRSAVIWMDNRAVAEVNDIRELFTEIELCKRTGRRISSELLAPKILWLRNHESANYKKIRKIIGLKDEIVRRLTGEIVTDYAHLNYTSLYNIQRREMDKDIGSALDIGNDLFPEGKSADEIVGCVSDKCSYQTGLETGIPVVCGSSDGTAAMYGGGIMDPQKAVLVSGTTDVLMMRTNSMINNLNCILSVNEGMDKDSYVVGGAMGLSGGTLDWVFRLLNWNSNDVINTISEVDPGSDGLFFIPGLSGERAPYWCEGMSGSLMGLNLKHKPEHIVRSVFEGISFRILRLIQELKENGLTPESINVVGGGSEIGIYNQIRADITGIPIVKLKESEASSLGIAVFCRKGIGDVSSLAKVSSEWIEPESVYYPDQKNHGIYLKLSKAFEKYISSTREFYGNLKKGF